MEFENRTVVVTGATGNRGRAVVDAFAGAGANLVLVGTRREGLVGHFGQETDRRL